MTPKAKHRLERKLRSEAEKLLHNGQKSIHFKPKQSNYALIERDKLRGGCQHLKLDKPNYKPTALRLVPTTNLAGDKISIVKRVPN